MTKLDGTARGGILVAIAAKYRLPVHFIGVGERVDDLAPFSARDFARALAGIDDGRGVTAGCVAPGGPCGSRPITPFRVAREAAKPLP